MSGIKRIEIQGRSDGDGMENNSFHERNSTESVCVNYYSTKFNTSGKKKEPKFVPYEPYKAATSPIVPKFNKSEKNSNFVIDSQKVNALASSVIKKNSYGKISLDLNSVQSASDQCFEDKECSKCLQKITLLENKLKNLEKEKKELESQFNVQVEVNADLKKMLLASLGEDMELKVSYMTEDKARLGMNVLEFSEEIKLKNEEIDKLSVECDVWKSKFEASSLMVDELAVWKKSLSQKVNEAIKALNLLLKEHETMFDELHACYSTLNHTQRAFNPNFQGNSKCDHSPQSLATLIKDTQSLATSLQERLLGSSFVFMPKVPYKGIRQFTHAETFAYQTLNDFGDLSTLKNLDLKDRKLKPGTIACEVLPHVCSKETTVNCCKHCSAAAVRRTLRYGSLKYLMKSYSV